MDNLRASLELQWANNSGSALANCDHYGFVKRCALARPMEMRGLSVRQKAPRMAVVITPGASGKSSETRSDLFPRSALFSYERCQATFGRLFGRTVVDYIRWALGGGRLFLTAPLTPWEAKRWECDRKSLPGLLLLSLFGTLPLRGTGLNSSTSASKLLSVHPSS